MSRPMSVLGVRMAMRHNLQKMRVPALLGNIQTVWPRRYRIILDQFGLNENRANFGFGMAESTSTFRT